MNKRCAFTGHRIIKDYNLIKEKTYGELVKLIDEGYTEFYNGGALGFDTLCAILVLELKKIYDIRLHLILPCKNHYSRWNEKQKAVFDEIIIKADTVKYAKEEYTDDCMFIRNRMLCDNCDLLLSHCTRSFGGSFYTVKCAKGLNKQIINIQ